MVGGRWLKMFSRNNYNSKEYLGRGDVNKNMGWLGTGGVCIRDNYS